MVSLVFVAVIMQLPAVVYERVVSKIEQPAVLLAPVVTLKLVAPSPKPPEVVSEKVFPGEGT